MARRRVETPPLSIEVFCHATAYWKSAASLGRHCNFPFPYNLPMVVYELFSLELFLKCLIKMRGKPIPRMHELSQLLSTLSKGDRDKIRSRYYKLRRAHHRPRVAWKSVIKRTSHLFDRARYHFEGTPWETDVAGYKGNQGVAELLRAGKSFSNASPILRCCAIISWCFAVDPHPKLVKC